jgi:uncharacterized membrane-anchored protein
MGKLLNRVPEVVVTFWMIKVLSTTLGETFADYLAGTLHFGLINTSIAMSVLLVLALINQIRLKRYVPAMYWLVVVLMSITGTLITDSIVANSSISLMTINLVFAAVLFTIFAFWYVNEQTLAMHSINTTKRELFYWAAILFTFALGTATGDYLAETLKLGYAQAALLFAASIAVVAFLYYALKVNGVLTFWLAYILTRPLGASIGDLLADSVDEGGLGFGTTQTSMLFLSIITSLIIYLSLKHNKSVSLADRAE